MIRKRLQEWEWRTAGYFTPPVTILLAINVILFLVQMIAGRPFTDSLRLSDAVWQGEIWRLLTGAFLHASPWHLIGNMLGLCFFGHHLSHHLGERSFWHFVIGTAILANLGHLLWSGQPAVGFSGVVYAFIFAAALLAPHARVAFMIIIVPLWVLALILGIFSVLSFANNLMNPGRGDMVAHDIHLIGGALGLATVYFRWRWRLPAISSKVRAFRAQQQEKREADHEQKLDELLAKVSRDGLNSLSDHERRFLKRYSDSKRSNAS